MNWIIVFLKEPSVCCFVYNFTGRKTKSVSVQHFILNIWLLTSFQNINWLSARKNVSMHPVFTKEKMSIVPVWGPFLHKNLLFIYFLEQQVHKKESKLEIMTMWVKGIFSNIRNVETVLVMNDLLHNIWENVLIKFISLRKIGGEVEAPFTQLPRKKLCVLA